MRKFLFALVVGCGALLALLVYERLFVEHTIGPSALLMISALGCLFVCLLVTLLLHGTRFRAMVANAWLVVISVTVAYVAVDVTAGLILIRPLSPPLVPDPYRHHRLVPDSYSQFEQRDFRYVQRVNNLGLRGPDRPMQKPAGSFRILMLGDSFTMGKGVNDDQTFSVLLERSLNRRFGACSGRRIEVLNAGVDSYAPVLSYIHLSRELYRLEADMVVLNLDVSDLVQEATYRHLATYGADGQLIAVPQPDKSRASLSERVRGWAEKHLYLTRLLLYQVNRLFGYGDLSDREVLTQANFEVAAHTLAGDVVPRDRQWSDVFESILRIRRFAEGHGMEFLLSVYPWGHQVNDTEWIPGRYNFMRHGAAVSDASLLRIEKFTADNGIRLANQFPDFRAHRGGGQLYFHYDNHWTAAGQAVMAQGLEKHLAGTRVTALCGQREGAGG